MHVLRSAMWQHAAGARTGQVAPATWVVEAPGVEHLHVEQSQVKAWALPYLIGSMTRTNQRRATAQCASASLHHQCHSVT